MASIADIRAKFPQYSDMSDAQLADAVHKKFYADMPVEEFNAKVGFTADPNAQAVAAGMPVVDPSMQSDGNSPSPAFQQALAQLHQAAGSLKDAPTEDRDRLVRANMEATKIQNMQGDKGLLRRAAEAAGANGLFGFADEAYANSVGAGARMLRDQVGYTEAAKREQALLDEQKRRRGTAANVIGDIGGGLVAGSALTTGGLTAGAGGVTAATPSWGGLTLAGRSLPLIGKTGAAIGEGAAYGGLYGSGNAKEGQRLEEGLKGAAIGGLTGGLFEVGGNALSRAVSSAKTPAAPAIDELAQATNDLYAKSRAAGVTIKAPAFDNVVNNVQLAAGRLNKDLRPNTAGIVDDVMALKGQNVTLEQLDELRQVVGQSMKRAEPQDVRTLTRIKTVIDHFSDNVKPGDITGDIRGFDFIKEGRKLAARKAKAETIAELVEKAQNQATGVENGMVIQMRQLANNKSRLSQFSKEEQKLIKGIARRGSVGGLIRGVSLLSPTSTFGAAIAGALGIGSGVVPAAALAGSGMAAKAIGNAMTRGKMNTLQSAIANGVVPQLQQLPNYLRPAISGATAGATGLLQ